jgi:hypothetical protein
MAVPPLFIGVVSHEGSRFEVNQRRDGLAALLGAEFPGSEVQVSVRNFFDESGRDVDAAMVQQALTAELQVERSWARFLGRARGPRWWMTHLGRQGKRLVRRAAPPSIASIRRLLNIEHAHLWLLEQALGSGAPWIVILEDDGFCDDVADLAAGLVTLFPLADSPVMVNLSESFSVADLGVTHLLRPASDVTWTGAKVRAVLESTKPVTNTVCAIAYTRSGLEMIHAALRGIPEQPVLPIDWKLNSALMALHGWKSDQPLRCLLVEPAPIIQMSMK